MKKSIAFISVILFFVLINSSNAQMPDFQWVKGMGSTSFEIGNAIVVDNSGNVYTTGTFSGTVDFDPGTGVSNLSSAGNGDVFVSKLDAAGNFIWAKRVGGTQDDQAYSIALDNTGNVHVTGNFLGTADFDPGAGVFNLNSGGNNNLFIFKLDNSGNFLWAKSCGGNLSGSVGNALTVDASGSVFITGSFEGTIDFDPGSGIYNLSSTPPSSDIFILKLNASGNLVWAYVIGNLGHDSGMDVCIDASGNLYTTVQFKGTVDLDPGPGTYSLTANSPALAIIKLDVLGNFVWAKGVNGTSNVIGNSTSIDALGNIYTTGILIGTADFDPGPGIFNLTAIGSNDSFVLKLDASGNFLWANSTGGAQYCVSNSIAVDLSGSAYTIGYFYGTVDFDPGPGIYNLTATGGTGKVFISKLHSDGSFAWARLMDGIYASAIDVDQYKNLYATGFYQGTVDFDPGSGIFNLTAVASSDIFVLKLDTCGIAPQPIDITSLSNKMICQNQTTTLSVTGSGIINWYSSPTSTVILNSGPNFVVQAINTGTTAYYVEANICSSGSSRTAITLTVSACTGIETSLFSTPSFEIYPNPGSGIFTLDLNNTGQIIITNIFGQEILNENGTIGQLKIDIQNHANGIYFLTVIAEGKPISTQKIVKQ